MTRFLAVVLFGATALGSAAWAQTPAPGATNPNSCKDLVSFLQQRGSAQPASPVTLDQAKSYESSNNTAECDSAIGRIQAAGIKLPADLAKDTQQAAAQPAQPAEAGHVTVQQPAPQVTVKQASPQVTVQQAQPQVTVRQPQPEITVRQPAPTITVQIPEPQITVRMPQPQVSVSMAQPKVAVNEAKPQVKVVQPAQPNVQVQQAAAAQANVKVVQESNGQPQVKYERDQAKVVVQQPTGQPQVKFESAAAAAPAATGASATAPSQTAAAENPPPATANQPAPAPATAAATATTATPAGQPISVSNIDNKKLYDGQGHELGDIKHVVENQSGQKFVVIGHGGFLGMGEKEVLVPLTSVHMEGDHLVVRGMTDEQIKGMPAWNQEAESSYKVLDGNQSVRVAQAQ